MDIVAASGSSFVTGLDILPRECREAMFAIFALCGLVDDIADGEGTKNEKVAASDNGPRKSRSRTPRTAVGEEPDLAIDRHRLPGGSSIRF
ncbi:squalene/phytoene synthase family protein [Rubellimicrobium roseum]|uniref:Uncharacterized protein n=1 Tax=Rubellimicrobium roseum TaxID=687525 RepID=A0A5C4NBX0_9RHOB|nr:squalene/phytoene synthase family protein [Rubellimicrobium roseum]TNC72203.1 hypothetical protein FHG71_09140 [Rubellimicrobium roseum]